ncbi:MAG: hypothetical protein ACOC0N_04320 [Chroococcales cyanobacterium]
MFFRFNIPATLLVSSLAMTVAIASCSPESQSQTSVSPNNGSSTEVSQAETDTWRQMTAQETERQWENILNNPLGIAALNQLAIEGFISPNCPKTFYINEQYGGFQTLLQVECPTGRGVSTAVAYDEMRVIFNRFEDNIETFEVRRISSESPPRINLP